MTGKPIRSTTQAPRKRLAAWLLIALAVAFIDQVTKGIVVDRFALYDSVGLTPFLNLVRAHNTGAAFSFLAGAGGWQRWFFVGIGLAASAFIVRLLHKHGSGEPLFSFALSMILGGAIGNVVDRLHRGYVVDFLDFHIGGAHFPSFNAADSSITLGAACLIVDEFRRWRRTRLEGHAQGRPDPALPGSTL